MNLTEHTDIGLRLLVLLGARAPERLSTHEMASVHGISHTHVQKVVHHLQNAGFVRTQRGRGGGVELALLPEDIRVGEVVQALEPHLCLVECFRPGRSSCRLDRGCALAHTLERARAAMLAEMNQSTIADIVSGSPHVHRLRAS